MKHKSDGFTACGKYYAMDNYKKNHIEQLKILLKQIKKQANKNK